MIKMKESRKKYSAREDKVKSMYASTSNYQAIDGVRGDHPIITPPKTNKVVYYTINVQSSDRDVVLYPETSRFRVYLKEPIKNVTRVELQCLQCPYVSYNVNLGSNTFVFHETYLQSDPETGDQSEATSSFTVFLTPGHYTPETLASELERILNMKSTGDGYVVMNLPEVNRLHFANTNNEILSFAIDLSVGVGQGGSVETVSMGGVMGFLERRAYSNKDLISGVDPEDAMYQDVIVSDGYINLAGPGYIALDIEQIETPYNEVASKQTFETPGGLQGTFAKIIADNSAGTILFFQKNRNYDVFSTFTKPLASIDRLDITWRRPDGSEIEFFKLPNSFTLLFECVSGEIMGGINQITTTM